MTDRLGDPFCEVNTWQPILNGVDGKVGRERGIVRLDEAHPDGSRITLEEGGVIAPWSITCGVHGLMAHTAVFASERDAREAVLAMKERLTAILDAIGSDRVDEVVERFVADF